MFGARRSSSSGRTSRHTPRELRRVYLWYPMKVLARNDISCAQNTRPLSGGATFPDIMEPQAHGPSSRRSSHEKYQPAVPVDVRPALQTSASQFGFGSVREHLRLGLTFEAADAFLEQLKLPDWWVQSTTPVCGDPNSLPLWDQPGGKIGSKHPSVLHVYSIRKGSAATAATTSRGDEVVVGRLCGRYRSRASLGPA